MSLAVRLERIVPTGNAGNFGADTVVFGLFRNGRFWTAGSNDTKVELVGAGLGLAAATELLDEVVFDGKAFEVTDGEAVEL
jgi:hypothetical protein